MTYLIYNTQRGLCEWLDEDTHMSVFAPHVDSPRSEPVPTKVLSGETLLHNGIRYVDITGRPVSLDMIFEDNGKPYYITPASPVFLCFDRVFQSRASTVHDYLVILALQHEVPSESYYVIEGFIAVMYPWIASRWNSSIFSLNLEQTKQLEDEFDYAKGVVCFGTNHYRKPPVSDRNSKRGAK